MDWHLLETSEVVSRLGSDVSRGLSSSEVALLKASHGPNQLQEQAGKPAWLILWEQFTSTMALVLSGAALLSAFVGSLKDCLAIMAIVCLFALLGFYQEFRAERTIAALKRLAVPAVRVRRDGQAQELPSLQLVPGDIVMLEPGNLVPADCRIIESHNLKIQEALLTGESDAVAKNSAVLSNPALTIGDRLNMAFMGTAVTYGRGIGIVVATGMRSELGRIADLLQKVIHESTPLQKKLDQLGRLLTVMAVLISIVYFIFGLLRGEELNLLLMTAVSLAVAAIPEGLPAVVTITLAIGSQRMLGRQALIRKLPAVETLGSVTVICTDKTGTLTENRMTVTELAPADNFDRRLLLLAAALCNDAGSRVENSERVLYGDPTETALLAAAIEAGFRPELLEQQFPRLAEIPFDSASKRMVTLHALSPAPVVNGSSFVPEAHWGERFMVVKGAADALLPLCADRQSQGRILAEAGELASLGRRVLAFAVRRAVEGENQMALDNLSGTLEFMGLVALMDPPRSEASFSIKRCLQAGIRPVMITGDHPGTASAIARAIGIPDEQPVVTGLELDEGCPTLLAGRTSVYARLSPEHKLLIVETLQRQGEVVAMTGDGINDAPALKKADIGIAMGISGTDVAREAADMVLLDDNFATIVSAVEEGRAIYDNICKFIEFSVAGNMGKIAAVLVLPFLGLPSPLTPLQLLWLNLLTDGLLGLGMGLERAEADVMRRRPIDAKARIFNQRMLRHTILTGALIGLSSVAITWYHWHNCSGDWQSVLFACLAIAQIGQAMALRSRNYSFFRIGYTTNPVLLAMVATVVILLALVVYLPLLQPVFDTTALRFTALATATLPGMLVFVVLELEKVFQARRTTAISS